MLCFHRHAHVRAHVFSLLLAHALTHSYTKVCCAAWQLWQQAGSHADDVTSVVINLKELVRRFRAAKSTKLAPFHVEPK